MHSRHSNCQPSKRVLRCIGFPRQYAAHTTRTAQSFWMSGKVRCSTLTSLGHESSNFSKVGPPNQRSSIRLAASSASAGTLPRTMCGQFLQNLKKCHLVEEHESGVPV